MQREIKFRGQRVDNKEWVYGTAMLWNGYAQIFVHHHMVNNNWVVDKYNVIPSTVGQYVRTDMYGGVTIDFYDGDIVMVQIPYREDLVKGEIYYDNSACAFRIKLHRDGGVYIDWLTVLTVRQVIGSIHTTPELIKQ